MNKTFNLLLIEDDQVDRMSFQRYLKKTTLLYKVDEYALGKPCIESFEEGKYDIVFLDYNLPDINGMDVLDQLLKIDPYCSVVLMTGEGDELLAAKAIKSGAADYLPKKSLSEVVLKQCLENIEMRKAMKLAEQSNKAKTEFLSRMSHELRTPMNAILGFSQVLIHNPAQNLSDDQKESVEEILKAGKHLLSLIDEVLELSEIESREITLSLESIEVKLVLEEVLKLLKPLADQLGIQIQNDISGDKDFWVVGDRVRLKQVLMNLISNGIKYNREYGRVKIYGKNNFPNSVKIFVEDSGMGLSREMQSRIFTPFDRLGKENSEISGTGIGLTICKDLMDLMRGSIEVRSKEGEGTCMIIELPMGREEDSYGGGSLSDIGMDSDELSGYKKTGSHSLLYVEDNPANLRLMESKFSTREDISLLKASDAKTGIQLAQTHQPDLILMDINLPGIDGVHALKELKKMEETKNIPVIAISANAMTKDIDRALSEGFIHYLVKPIDMEQLLRVVKQELGS
ncbi:MAG: response regulator [Candidatus Nitronauta litoralis]|uniref:histidine kinase n=1 Tax=Candidatus Nitronauta litoralis TaxID=2705533 RepID=A0A7T0BTH8_9BACT|nr:MAG: response regulator [Candidatus Nitronauta litoralis]